VPVSHGCLKKLSSDCAIALLLLSCPIGASPSKQAWRLHFVSLAPGLTGHPQSDQFRVLIESEKASALRSRMDYFCMISIATDYRLFFTSGARQHLADAELIDGFRELSSLVDNLDGLLTLDSPAEFILQAGDNLLTGGIDDVTGG